MRPEGGVCRGGAGSENTGRGGLVGGADRGGAGSGNRWG